MAQLYDVACQLVARGFLDRTEEFDLEALAIFLHRRDPAHVIALLETSTIDVPIGPWRALAADEPESWVLIGAAALETVLLDLPRTDLPEPWRTALDPTADWRWVVIWQRLFSLTARSRVLNHLASRLVARTFGRTWLTAVSGSEWQHWAPLEPTAERPIESLLHGATPQPWRLPRASNVATRRWSTRCLGGDVDQHWFDEPLECHDTSLLALPVAVIVSPVGAVIRDARQPASLGQRPMPVHDTPGYWLYVIERTSAGQDNAVVKLDEGTVVLYDSFLTSYYHCLIDYLPRLESARDLIETYGFTIAVPAAAANTLGALLEAFGWGYAIRTLDPTPAVFDWVAVIGGCQLGVQASPQAIRWLADLARTRFVAPQRGRKLLISRADAASRRLLNEAALFEALAPHGFELLVPTTLGVAGQLTAMAAAEVVVAPHGAALANLIAAAPGTRVVEISASLTLSGFYSNIAAVLDQDHTTVLARDVGGDLEVDPALVLTALGYTTA